MQLVLRKSLVCLPFVTSLSQNGGLNYICGYIRANSETCRAVIVVKLGQMTPSLQLSMYYTRTNTVK